MSGLQKRSISLSGHRTSIALEGEFWHVIDHMAHQADSSLAAFIARIDTQRSPEQGLASILRVTALYYVATHGEAVLPEPYSTLPASMVEE